MDNIKLDYPVIIKHNNDSLYARECEVFMDEHNIQWVKFKATNGYHPGKEHMIRTDLVMIIRNETSKQKAKQDDPAINPIEQFDKIR